MKKDHQLKLSACSPKSIFNQFLTCPIRIYLNPLQPGVAYLPVGFLLFSGAVDKQHRNYNGLKQAFISYKIVASKNLCFYCYFAPPEVFVGAQLVKVIQIVSKDYSKKQ